MRIMMPLLVLCGCAGVSFDTHIAVDPVVRQQMMQSVAPGDTTEMQFVTRWGKPFQRIHDGGRVEYVYRSALGDPADFVIVTFEYGVAIAVRSTETEGCRAEFAPRFPGYGWDTPDTVKPIGWCGSLANADLPPVIKDVYVPMSGTVK